VCFSMDDSRIAIKEKLNTEYIYHDLDELKLMEKQFVEHLLQEKKCYQNTLADIKKKKKIFSVVVSVITFMSISMNANTFFNSNSDDAHTYYQKRYASMSNDELYDDFIEEYEEEYFIIKNDVMSSETIKGVIKHDNK